MKPLWLAHSLRPCWNFAGFSIDTGLQVKLIGSKVNNAALIEEESAALHGMKRLSHRPPTVFWVRGCRLAKHESPFENFPIRKKFGFDKFFQTAIIVNAIFF